MSAPTQQSVGPSTARSGRGLPPAQAGALAIAALAVAGATAVGWRWAGRPARVGPITMGPGGWVSVKGTRPPGGSGARPWWARMLRAYRV